MRFRVELFRLVFVLVLSIAVLVLVIDIDAMNILAQGSRESVNFIASVREHRDEVPTKDFKRICEEFDSRDFDRVQNVVLSSLAHHDYEREHRFTEHEDGGTDFSAGGSISAIPGKNSKTTNEKIPEKSTPSGVVFPGILDLVPPQGDEQTAKNTVKTGRKSNGGNAGGNIPCDLAELVELWPKLDANVRNECLELARRGLAKHR